MEREFIIAQNILTASADIHYAGSSKTTFGEYVALFVIDGKKYEYHLILKDLEILNWMKSKKKLSDPILLNYAKKNAYEVWRDNTRIQSERIRKAYANVTSLDGSTMKNCSGWYVPKYECLMIFGHGRHRAFMDDYFNPFDDKFGIKNKSVLKAIEDARKNLSKRMEDGIDYDDLWNCNWIRFNISPGNSVITTNQNKYDEVMDLLNELRPYIRSEVMVELSKHNTAIFKMNEVVTKDDLLRMFWMSKAANRKVGSSMKELSQLVVEVKKIDDKIWKGLAFLQRVTLNKKFEDFKEDGINFGLESGKFERDVKALRTLGNVGMKGEGDFYISTFYDKGFVLTNSWEISFIDGDVQVFENELIKLLEKYGKEFKKS